MNYELVSEGEWAVQIVQHGSVIERFAKGPIHCSLFHRHSAYAAQHVGSELQ